MKYDILPELRIEAPHTPTHRAQLRRVLEAEAIAPASIVTRLARRLTPIQGVFITMKKSLITNAGLAAFAVAFVAVAIFSPLNPSVAAQQVTQDGIRTVSQLSQTELAKLKATLAADPQTLLREAANAKDLTKISKDEFTRLTRNGAVLQYGDGTGNVSGKVNGKNGDVADTGNVDASTVPTTPTTNTDNSKTGGSNSSAGSVDTAAIDARIAGATDFVKYTGANGKTVVIAFDSSDTPVYTATF